MTRLGLPLLAGALVLTSACQLRTQSSSPEPRQLTAQLYDAQGSPVGIATLTDASGAVHLVVDAQGLTPGLHAIHVHDRGVCTAPDFMSAGLHYNPSIRHHGLLNSLGPHAGDFPDLEVGADGHARFDVANTSIRLSGPGALLPDSASIVIHAQADDQLSDPTGNSGARIACGVLTRGGGRRRVP